MRPRTLGPLFFALFISIIRPWVVISLFALLPATRKCRGGCVYPRGLKAGFPPMPVTPGNKPAEGAWRATRPWLDVRRSWKENLAISRSPHFLPAPYNRSPVFAQDVHPFSKRPRPSSTSATDWDNKSAQQETEADRAERSNEYASLTRQWGPPHPHPPPHITSPGQH